MRLGTTPSGPGAADRWRRVEALFAEALAHDARERGAFLDAACPDAQLRAEVESLLLAHEQRGQVDELAEAVMDPLRLRAEQRGVASESAGPSRAGEVPALSRYRVIDKLGGGGMGIVYRARDERLERDVALKFLPPHLSADEAAKKRFIVEARAAAALEHPNVCTVHEIGETDDGQLYIVMGYYEGETLDKRIARGPLPLDDAIRIAGDVARGLARAHERGIVHRDVKPANVMLVSDGGVKVLDFGIAKLSDVTITQTVGAIGTVAYMSPEQAFGEAVDQRTDVWGLGVVCYEMLTGVRPFRGPSEHAVLVAALSGDPDPVSSLRDDLPPGLDAVFARALAKPPASRYAGVLELASALAAAGLPASRPASATGTWPTEERTGAEPRESLLTRGGERRRITVVSCAIAGYEELIEQLAPEETDRVLARVRDAATEAAAYHGGVVNHYSGDELVMLFGVPTAHEDDCLRAVRAALALRARVCEIDGTMTAPLRAPLRLRAGMHTGPVVARRLRGGDRRFRVTGAPMDVADQLAALAGPGDILLTPECSRLVAPFVEMTDGAPVSLHAGAPPVVPQRALATSDVSSRLEHAERTGLTPYAGRVQELRMLEELLAAALSGSGRVAVVIGEAGTGKSRLLHELRRRSAGAGAALVVGRCDAYGGTTPFLPFVQAVRDALGLRTGGAPAERHDHVVAAVNAIDPSLSEYLPLYLALLSIPSGAHPIPLHWQGPRFQAAMLDALAALFTLRAARAPTLLMLEDWHWADEASRLALQRLSEVVAASRLLVVVTARPEGVESWQSSEYHVRLHLGPLDPAASESIARAVFGAATLAPELADQLRERTGGNPFFLEEVCLALREENAVVVRDGVAVAVGEAGLVHVPDTVQGVVRARIDRLDEDAHDLLLVASVVGREFTLGVLSEVTEPSTDLARTLDSLKAAGLVQQLGVLTDPAFRFKHVVTREVAYESLLEHQRKTLHAAVGRAIERRYADQLEGQVERLAHHFARAEAWPEAVRYGIQAADRAGALSRYGDALGTLEQVEAWIVRLPDEASRWDVTADVLLRQERLCETLGNRARQLRIVERLIEVLTPHGASPRLAEAYLRQGDVYTLVRRFDDAERALDTAIRISVELGNPLMERNALRSIVLLRSFEGRHAEALESIERVMEISRARGDTAAYAGDLATLGNVLRELGQHERALHELETELEHAAAAAPVGRSAYFQVLGNLYREFGDNDRALHYLQIAHDEAVQRRIPVALSFCLHVMAQIYLEQGRIEDALAAYQRDVDESRRARYAEGLSRALLSLGQVLWGLGRVREGLTNLREAALLFEQLEGHDVAAQAWRRVAEAHERLNEPAEARHTWERLRALCRENDDDGGEMDALEGIGRTARLTADTLGSASAYESALLFAIQRGDRVRELAHRNALAIAHWEGERYAESLVHYEQALRLCVETGDRVHHGLMLNSVGAVLLRLGRLDEARASLEEGARVNAATGERRLESHALATLGDAHVASGRLDDARLAVEASLAIRRETGDRRGEGWMLERLARILSAGGDRPAARAACDAAQAIAREIDDSALRDALDRVERTMQAISDDPPRG